MLECLCSLSGTSHIRLCWRPQLNRSGKAVSCTLSEPIQCRKSIYYARQLPHGALICSASWSARCAAEQTQTVQRPSTPITNAPIQGNDKSPQLDDGGTGFPPRDDGGGGGGPHWSGGFFLFGLLVLLGLLKDQESKEPYRDIINRR